ncbi:DnaJ-class molecular chaperone [Streptomyces achromogenes]|uniref:hypothetical protein n=1 Tax=Streptomyces achromogenes TaxID=67255 RepID=UPI002785C296|nr:hypothetical protein [Streptomyces achromogenes]MDQ0831554.1 DnaJ-class molecular chaperone [Streptomyces achromogenes]
MPQHARFTRVCRDCAGFASALVTTGARHLDGTRATVRVDCPTCKGTGTARSASVLVQAGR